MQDTGLYVSITGLRLRHWSFAPLFWWHAIGAMTQARAALGNLSAEARLIDGTHHTVSVWQDRDMMQRYLRSGAHVRAMRVFPKIATGSVAGFLASHPPSWADVPALLRDQGRVV
jgi:hypothetical protein